MLISPSLDCLRTALQADRFAITTLFSHYVRCNDVLADHPHIPVRTDVSLGVDSVGVLGLINGVLVANGLQKVAIVRNGDDIEFVDYVPAAGKCPVN